MYLSISTYLLPIYLPIYVSMYYLSIYLSIYLFLFFLGMFSDVLYIHREREPKLDMTHESYQRGKTPPAPYFTFRFERLQVFPVL